ncbi:MAG: PTS sugar transporter subunit IIA [Sebaldella sp.]|nr:PTS sugar transporter subunit IIA [Sebaldella sp.]
MDITKVINENMINLNLKGRTKEEVLDEMSDLLFEHGVLTSKEEFLKDVYLREAEGQTGLGNYVAIPHGKSNSVLKTSLAIGRTTNDIAWETLDGKPVRCIILFAVRAIDKTTVHIKLLSQVAEALADDDVVEELLTKKNPKEIIELFKEQEIKE